MSLNVVVSGPTMRGRTDGVLAEAYERVIDSYFDSQENDPRYVQFYKRLEQLMKQHVSGQNDARCRLWRWRFSVELVG